MPQAASAADKVGVVGTTVSALCCLGTPALVSVLSALGLGFLINDAVLVPLLLGSLILVKPGGGIEGGYFLRSE